MRGSKGNGNGNDGNVVTSKGYFTKCSLIQTICR